jgi:general secretion pathway protein J
VKLRCSRGLTLVEVLVALAILGLLSILGYRALDSTLRVRDRASVEAGRWRELSFFFDRLRDDVDQPASRGPRQANGAPLPVWRGNDSSLELAALGRDANPLRHVAYRLNAGVVELLLWPAFDAAPGTMPEVHQLVGAVRSLHFRYLSRSRVWIEAWPPKAGENETPLAVHVDLTLADGTRVNRMFALP